MSVRKHSHCTECGKAISRPGADSMWVDVNGVSFCTGAYVAGDDPARDHTPLPERDFCSVANGDCLNPPGYATGSGHFTCDDPRTTARCTYCGETVCANCRYGKRGAWVCKSHSAAELRWVGL